MDMLREYQLYQKAERLRVGSMWARTVQVENGKTVQNDLLFTSWDGTPFDLERLTTWFPHFLRAHDLPAVHFHSLRHTYASLMIAAHVPITTVSGRLGHAQTSTTTDIYAGFIRTADAAASDAMEIVLTTSAKRAGHKKSGQKPLYNTSVRFIALLFCALFVRYSSKMKQNQRESL